MYKLKRHISIFLVIALVFSVAAFSSVSTASAAEGGFEYAVDEDGYASVTGYTGNGTNLEIPSEYDGHAVRYIDEFAFLQNTSVTVKNLKAFLSQTEYVISAKPPLAELL